MYGNFFPNLSSIIYEKCTVTPNFLFGFWKPLLRSLTLLFPHGHKPHKNIVVLGGKFLINKKPKYPEMRRTYAQ